MPQNPAAPDRSLATAADHSGRKTGDRRNVTLSRLRRRRRGGGYRTAGGAAAQIVHDQGLVSVLRALHDDLDLAVAEAYGWPAALPTEDILFRLVELNAARAAEERSGLVRWLRPEFQRTTETQAGLGVEIEEEAQPPARVSRLAWPPSLPERVRAVRDYLRQAPAPVSPETVARSFIRARNPEVAAILETLAALGQATHTPAGYRA